jgi:hypothetical protein
VDAAAPQAAEETLEKKEPPAAETAPQEAAKPAAEPPAAAKPAAEAPPPQFTPIPDRWRIGFPEWDRYRSGLGAPYSRRSNWLNPYRQNLLKGDLPVLGQDVFLNLGLTSDTLADFRSRYLPSNVSSRDPGQFRFFGSGRQDLVDQLFLLSAEVFKGDTAFRPKDWAFRVTAGLDVNHLSSRETGVVNIDVRDQTSRTNVDFGPRSCLGSTGSRTWARSTTSSPRAPVSRASPPTSAASSSWTTSRESASSETRRGTGTSSTWPTSTRWRRTPTAG